MSLALDIGSDTFRSLRLDESRLLRRQSRAIYVVLPDHLAARKLLARAGVSYISCDDSLLLIGDAAQELAPSFQIPCAHLLPQGFVATSDPITRQVVGVLVEALLPPPRHPQEICCLTQPVNTLRRADTSPQRAFLEQLVRLRGYEPHTITAGHALATATLAPEGFTGLAVVLGSSRCEFSVTHHGQEVAAGSLPFAGSEIDVQLAQRLGLTLHDHAGRQFLDIEQARRRKHQVTGTLVAPHDEVEVILSQLYRDLLTQLFRKLDHLLAQDPAVHMLPGPFTLACSGGATQVPGFFELLQQMLEHRPLALPVHNLRQPTDPQTAVVRGCLIHAELETQSRQHHQPHQHQPQYQHQQQRAA